ncbi:MAG: hypothetical protein F9K24_03925 [Leptonema illini]|uniref:Uncharacterized protein n=2 Tax=Leptonema illini TaxID=183 RepID=H2CE63_9LEPT|nr:hypothetical protein [Leptonema illini]EHQ06615.1 hypothetical protein Lepil_1932 [Leptonema illini DSM 21528]KAB2934938.1 MAG: hypothetical protein F9K24_03925 [Leptonema illini]PKL32876.1 MAG: hypothetical protein CVV45_10490 [Spirochaetae bacterium HGW-Spirochaetae-10]
MRAVNEQKLQLLLFHELRRRLAALTLEDERLTEKMAVELLADTLHQIPELQASVDGKMQLHIRTPSGIQTIPVQNIIDGLCLVWNEFRERQNTTP